MHPSSSKALAFFSVFLFFITTSACSTTATKPSASHWVEIGQITDKKIPEASGIAASQRQDDVFWLINDSGNSASVYAVQSSGERIGRVKLKGIKNTDWEDLVSFEYKGKPYLLIADVGDNKAKRDKLTLHFIKEPKAKDLAEEGTLSIKPKWSLEYTYEDGARDCESVAVDLANERIILLTKRDDPPVFYELPLQKKPKKQRAVAKRIGELQPLPVHPDDIHNLKFLAFGDRPTAMDMSADGKNGVILNYVNAYHFSLATPSERFLFDAPPTKFTLPNLPQAEAVCLDRKGNIVVTSEQLPAPIIKVNLGTHNH